MQAALAEAMAEGRRRRLADRQAIPRVRRYYCRSLKNLCVSFITKNPQYFKDKSDAFSCLPRELHTFVQAELLSLGLICSEDDQSKKFSQEVVHSLVSWNMQELVFSSFWTEEAATLVLDMAVQKCATGLLRLEVLKAEPNGWLPSLKLTLPHFTNLRHLRLDRADDELFAIIGRNLPNLRSLSVYPTFKNNELTDVGLGYLCVDDGLHGRCVLLQQVDLHKQCVSVTAQGVLLLLENLTHIIKITHTTSLEGLIMFVRKHNPIKLNITTSFYLEADQLSNINNSDLELLLSYKPKINEIKINGEINFTSLYQISDRNLTVILITPSFTLTKQLLFHLGTNITDLRISGNSEVDISIIAKHCKKLNHLFWESSSTESFMYSFETTFKNLSLIYIKLSSIESKLFPLDALKAILSSEYLTHVSISDTDLTDEFLQNVINLSKSNPKILSNICLLVLSGIKGISFDVLQKFVCYAPALESSRLIVQNCHSISEAQVEQLCNFITSLTAVEQVE